jgi:hypothetical protein
MAKPEGAIRGNSEIHQPVPEDGNSGQPGNSSSAIPRERRTGATWGSDQSAPPKDVKFEATRRSIAGKSRKMQGTGQPGNSSIGDTRHRRIGATRNFITGTVEDAKVGATRQSITGTAEWTECTGQLVDSSPARPKDAWYGATRRRIVGQAGRLRGRGNSEPHLEAERDDA